MALPNSPAILLLALVGLLAAIKLPLIIVRAFRSPLNKVPGPWHARWTNIRLKLAVITGQRMYYIHDMHKKYGPVVRLTPTEVAVSDVQAFQQIHKIGSGFNKSQWYDDLTKFERPTLFVMSDAKQHAARRKLLARGFSKSYLRQTWEPLVRAKVELTVQMMREESKRVGLTDVMKWWTLLATDVTTHLMFGKSFEMIEKGEKDRYIQTLEAALQGGGIGAELPLVKSIGKLLPGEACARMFRGNEYILQYGIRAIRGAQEGGDQSNIFAKIISESEKGAGLDDLDVTLEATALIVAGSDTTGTSLTYLIWAVLSRPQLRDALQKELQALPNSYTDQDLEELPLLNAIIEETLRLYGAAPGSLPRSVPKGGADLAGYYLPANTTVSTQAFTIHRDASLFSNPLEFNPDRWLQLDTREKLSAQEEKAKAAYHPFGAGSRVCMGVHLAQMELRLAAAEFFRRCPGAKLAPSTTDESMEMENFFLIAPKTHRCEILIEN